MYRDDMERAELAALRGDRGYTQEELGEELGVTGLTVSRYERGVSTPQGKVKRRYARALNISMGRLNTLLNGSNGADIENVEEVEEDDEERLLAPKWFSIYYAVEQSAAPDRELSTVTDPRAVTDRGVRPHCH